MQIRLVAIIVRKEVADGYLTFSRCGVPLWEFAMA